MHRTDEGRPGGIVSVDAPCSCWMQKRRSGKDQTTVREVMVAGPSERATGQALPIT